jgi:hypothetical protein
VAETLTGDELVAAAFALMDEKGVTISDLEAEGWGDPALLSEDEVNDVVAWLDSYKPGRPQQQPTEEATTVQRQMAAEARAAGLRASDAQKDPAVKRGYLYEKKIGSRRVTVEQDPNVQREGKVMLIGRVWIGTDKAVLVTERELVSESNLEGKTKQLAFRLTQNHARV